MLASGQWSEQRGTNVLDSGAPWYDTYATSDGKFVSIGAIEPKFFAALVERLGLEPAELAAQNDRAAWPALRERIAARFASRTRDAWCEAFAGSDACFAPVLTFAESRGDTHGMARHSTIELGGIAQPAPAPRFSRTPGQALRPPPERGGGGRAALRDWGLASDEIEALAGLGLGTLD